MTLVLQHFTLAQHCSASVSSSATKSATLQCSSVAQCHLFGSTDTDVTSAALHWLCLCSPGADNFAEDTADHSANMSSGDRAAAEYDEDFIDAASEVAGAMEILRTFKRPYDERCFGDSVVLALKWSEWATICVVMFWSN